MSDQERWLNEILDILGLPRDTAYRDYTRELAERGASLEQIYGTPAITDENAVGRAMEDDRPAQSAAPPAGRRKC